MPRRMLITAGPTHEPIDAVRYIANRSSGKMGIAIAEAARDAGWDVTLLLGPTSLNPCSAAPGLASPDLAKRDDLGEPRTSVRTEVRAHGTTQTGEPAGQGSAGAEQANAPATTDRNRTSAPIDVCDSLAPTLGEIKTVRFTSTADLQKLLVEYFPKCDVLVMAAAVADYRPVKSAGGKMERNAKRLTLELEPTPDLVAECAQRKRPDQFIVGFALEEQGKLRDRALEKLKRKGLDAIVANPLDTMGASAIDATVFRFNRSSQLEDLWTGVSKKAEFSLWLVRWLGEVIR